MRKRTSIKRHKAPSAACIVESRTPEAESSASSSPTLEHTNSPGRLQYHHRAHKAVPSAPPDGAPNSTKAETALPREEPN